MTIEKHYLELLRDYNIDLKEILKDFTDHRNRPPMYANMPPYSGALMWSLGLRLRLNTFAHTYV